MSNYRGKSRGYNDRNKRGSGRNYNSGPRQNFRSEEREMHPAKCSDCGQDTQVPFVPTEGKPVFCKECFQKYKKPRY